MLLPHRCDCMESGEDLDCVARCELCTVGVDSRARGRRRASGRLPIMCRV